MRVFEVILDEEHQTLAELADLDLLAALHLLKSCRAGEMLLAQQICYLLHQSMEKWIKLSNQIGGSSKNLRANGKNHSLKYLFDEPLLGTEFVCICERIEIIDERILEQSFASAIRYSSVFEVDAPNLAFLMLPIAFECRRTAKSYMKQKLLGGETNG
jgi:hypothetical protein